MSKEKVNVGIVGLGIYLPKNKMTAKEISEATQGHWAEDAVINKLGMSPLRSAAMARRRWGPLPRWTA